MNEKSISILQITDTHLFADKNGELVGRNTWNSFSAVIDLALEKHKKPNMVIHTGDMTQDYSEAAYLAAAESLSQFGCPVYWIPGNHDRAVDMSNVLVGSPLSMEKEIITENWHIILLDSAIDGKVYGELKESELHRLSEAVGAYPEKYFMVCLHHQPVPINVGWLDRLGLQHPERFLGLICQHSQLRAVVWGHVHLEFNQYEANVHYMSTPSTCIQFSPSSDNFALDHAQPGYRWFELTVDGRVETGVNRLTDFEDGINFDSKGY